MWLRLARWWLTLLGGLLLGAGLVLHGQLVVTGYLRDEVANTFFLWRAIGQATFIFQDDVTKSALAVNEIPQSVLDESDRMAWILSLVGLMIALSAPLIRPWSGSSKG